MPTFKILLPVLLTLAFAACSSKKKTEPKIAEIVPKEKQIVDAPEEELFSTGKRLYEGSLYNVAKDSFDSLRDSYPVGPYAEFAEIKSADCSFELREYDAAALLYEEYLKSHPTSKAAPYALLQIGLGHFLSHKGVGRDVATLQRALDSFTKLVEQYPESPFAEAGRAYRKDTVERLAEGEKVVADFYRKRGQMAAYEARVKHYEQKWEPELKAVNLAASPPPYEANVSQETPKLVEVSRRRTAEPERSPAMPEVILGDKVDVAVARPSSSSSYSIKKVECQPNLVILHLSRPMERGDAAALAVESTAELSRLTLPSATALPGAHSCFGAADLKLKSNGIVELAGNYSFDVTTIDNPPRVLLIVK